MSKRDENINKLRKSYYRLHGHTPENRHLGCRECAHEKERGLYERPRTTDQR